MGGDGGDVSWCDLSYFSADVLSRHILQCTGYSNKFLLVDFFVCTKT